MAVTVLLRMNTKPGASQKMIDLLVGMLPHTRKRQGFIQIQLIRSQENENDLVLVQKWDSRQDHELYTAWRIEIGSFNEAADLLDGSFSIEYFDEIPV